jgi:hypothetical protein
LSVKERAIDEEDADADRLKGAVTYLKRFAP